MTFGELAAQFIASGTVRPHHIYHLKFLLPFFCGHSGAAVHQIACREFRRRARMHNPSIKDATINRDLSVLRHILYWAVDEQLLAANPLARMKMARERRTRRQVLSVAEEQLLLRCRQGSPARHDHRRARHRHAARAKSPASAGKTSTSPSKLLFVTRSKTPEGESREIPLDRTVAQASA